MNWIQKLFRRKNINEPKDSALNKRNVEIINFKNVMIQMRWPTYGGDLIETDTVKVPIGLTEDEEKKFIDEYVWDNWYFLYGY